jgi:hypothetical protein
MAEKDYKSSGLIGNAWLVKTDGCFWLHVRASDQTIASINLSAEDEPSIRETLEKWAEEQLSIRFPSGSSN